MTNFAWIVLLALPVLPPVVSGLPRSLDGTYMHRTTFVPRLMAGRYFPATGEEEKPRHTFLRSARTASTADNFTERACDMATCSEDVAFSIPGTTPSRRTFCYPDFYNDTYNRDSDSDPSTSSSEPTAATTSTATVNCFPFGKAIAITLANTLAALYHKGSWNTRARRWQHGQRRHCTRWDNAPNSVAFSTLAPSSGPVIEPCGW